MVAHEPAPEQRELRLAARSRRVVGVAAVRPDLLVELGLAEMSETGVEPAEGLSAAPLPLTRAGDRSGARLPSGGSEGLSAASSVLLFGLL